MLSYVVNMKYLAIATSFPCRFVSVQPAMKCSVVFIFLYLLSARLSFTVCSRLPPQWCSKVAELCEGFDDGQVTQPTVIRHLASSETLIKDPVLYLFPPIIMWSPVEQFQAYLQINFFLPQV